MESDALIFLTYDVRAGTDDTEYHDFLRDIDSPFFNAQPGIVCYENWEIVETKPEKASFRFFDLIYVDSIEAASDVFTTPAIQEFSADWHARWGINPVPTPETVAGNYHAAIYQIVGQRASIRLSTAHVLLYDIASSLEQSSSNADSNADRWALDRSLVGPAPRTELEIDYTPELSLPVGGEVMHIIGRRLTTRP